MARTFSNAVAEDLDLARLHFLIAVKALMLSLAIASPPSGAAETGTTAEYVVSLAGVNIASASIRFTDRGGDYAIDLDAYVSGVGTLVAEGTATARSEGRATGDRLVAREFGLETRANGESFSVDVEYAGGNATGFVVAPPLVNNLDRVPVERKDLKGVTDPLGSFILKGGTLGAPLCERDLKVFTGVERYDIDMNFAATQTATSPRTGYQGPVVLCRLRYIPVSGHFTSSEITRYLANSDRILIWYMPLGDTDYFIPYRVLMDTSVGDLSMVLTALH